jgi:hypothetical protein
MATLFTPRNHSSRNDDSADEGRAERWW